MNWRLCGLDNMNDKFHFTEARDGVAAKGEPKVVLRTWWFDSVKERDDFLCQRHEISTTD